MNERYPFTLPPLPYPADALEPYIPAAVMTAHHDHCFPAYIDALNTLLSDRAALRQRSPAALTAKGLPEDIRHNAGGLANHTFFFESMSPCSPPRPEGILAAAINACFGSLPEFKESFKTAGLRLYGSGWVWLTALRSGILKIAVSRNQEPCPMGRPLLVMDVWEHAYFLKYLCRRGDYIDNWLCVANWQRAEALFERSTGAAV